MPHEVRADRRPVGGDDVDRAGREADLGCQLGQTESRQRRLRIGLEDDGAARRERRRELPRRHQQRVVPRDDLRGDADRLLQRVEEQRAADRVRAAGDRGDRRGVEPEVLGGAEELRLHGRARLAHVPRLELDELPAVGDDRVGERVQEPRALGRPGLPPVPVQCSARGFDRAVDVLLARQLSSGQRFAGGRLDQLPGLGALDLLSADEEAGFAFRGRAHGPDDTEASRSETRMCSVSSRA